MSEKFRVWDAANSSELAEWLAFWNAWPEKEPFAHPAYVSLFSGPKDRPLCAAWRSGNGGILFPLILRDLKSEKWAENDRKRDLISPYGYGGAYCWGNIVGNEFWPSLERWAKDWEVVSCFTRLSLWRDQILEPNIGQVEAVSDNVVVNLKKGTEVVWKEYKHKVRKNVQRAIRDGLKTEVDIEGRRLSDFLEIYYDTMKRREARSGYFFPESFFSELMREMRGSFAYFHTLAAGEVVSTEMVLFSRRNVYSFLGGTREKWFESRPNDLLKHSIISWAINNQKTSFILGGGYQGNDGIFEYKRSFAPDGVIPFCVHKIIFSECGYSDLIEQRRAYEKLNGCDWYPRIDYFPGYRS